jgi:type I restriction enzyme M protein
LRVPARSGDAPVESLFQGSKVFGGGGPYTDLYLRAAHEAKRDPRVRESGELLAFEYEGRRWPLEPKTLFYDWLYLQGVAMRPELWPEILKHDGFTDIEFNPARSINCQARSAALFVALRREGCWESVMQSPEAFETMMRSTAEAATVASEGPQISLL